MSLVTILLGVTLIVVATIVLLVLNGALSRRLFDMRSGTIRITLDGLLGLGAGIGGSSPGSSGAPTAIALRGSARNNS